MIDGYHIDFTAPEVRQILAILTDIHRTPEIEMIVQDAGLSPADVQWDLKPILIWRSVLRTAVDHQALGRLLDTVAESRPALRIRLTELRSATATVTPPVPEPAAADYDAPTWKNFSADGRAEAVIVAGQPTFVDISFLAIGLARARSVCRLVTRFPGEGSGTAFRIGERLLLTNHHVLYDHDNGDRKITSVQAWFNYETDEHGLPRPIQQIDCDPQTVVGEKSEDWAVIRTVAPIPEQFPVLPLADARAPKVDDRVCIIQHPLGLPKKIAFQHNLVRSVDQFKIQYWTDTDFGSSGAPVFDENWDVVALHHFTVPTPDDKTRAGHRNQGRRIDRLLSRMTELGVYPGARQ